VTPAIHLLDMPYASIGRKMCDDSALAQDVVIRFQAELDMQLVSYVEAEVEL
jgi:hypothetical protein